VPEGALYYGKKHRRTSVFFDSELRELTSKTAQELHTMINSGITPPPEYSKRKCDNCSLVEICIPRAANRKRTVQNYIARMLDT